jgi:arylsulfatase A-like enzyme
LQQIPSFWVQNGLRPRSWKPPKPIRCCMLLFHRMNLQCLSSVTVFFTLITVSNSQPPCDYRLLLSLDGDLPNMPIAIRSDIAADAQQCAFECIGLSDCVGFNYLSGTSKNSCTLLPSCPYPSGCCWLKKNASTFSSLQIRPENGCNEACSFIIRPDPNSLPPLPPPTFSFPNHSSTTRSTSYKNVLYLIVDDMRPDAFPWNANFMYTPNLSKLASQSIVFNRAYCNIAVCSPSRQSFLTGRYPTHTGVFNFINHFRQSNCSINEIPDISYGKAGDPFSNTLFIYDGGSGQCCSFCSSSPTCQAWTLFENNCTLFNKPPSSTPISTLGAISGRRGDSTTRDFITIPQYFLNAGYFTQGTGKVFHTEEGGSGPAPFDGPGTGMPPLQDPFSWSRFNSSLSNVNSIAPMRPCEDSNGSCSIPANLSGDVENPKTSFRFCDRIIGDDAVLKLRLASDNLNTTRQPFFLAVGFRKPHLPFRHPSAYDSFYPTPSEIPLAKHKTLNETIPKVAFHQTSLAEDPFIPIDDLKAGILRRDYYSSISWMDSQIGKILGELDILGLKNDTLVVFHADHGFSLGESGEWEKFTVWEAGTRVPLLIRAPWVNGDNNGTVSNEIVELVDVFPTLTDLAGLVEPIGVDGSSLVPAMLRSIENRENINKEDNREAKNSEGYRNKNDSEIISLPSNIGEYAFSIYPRCPADITNSSNFWKNNDCLYTERTKISIMGLSIRVDNWRYTEYRWWLPNLQPDWERLPAGIELFTHEGDTGEITTYDVYEVVNFAGMKEYVQVQAALALQLRAAYNEAAMKR